MRTLRLTNNLVALQPLLRKRSDGGIEYAFKYVDDRTQWLVINMSRKSWVELEGHVQNGCHVIIRAGAEHAHEFPDKVVITDASNIVAVVEPPTMKGLA